MKTFPIFLSLLLLACLSSPALSQTWTGNINGFIGQKTLDDNDWEPVEDQFEMGILIDFKKDTWPVSIAIDVLRSKDDDDLSILGTNINIEATTLEFDFGVRKIWDTHDTMRPFLGAGLGWINADMEGSSMGASVSDDDSALGLWVDGGVYWMLTEHFNLGFEGRYSFAEVDIYGVDAEAGGLHFGALFGYHW